MIFFRAILSNITDPCSEKKYLMKKALNDATILNMTSRHLPRASQDYLELRWAV
jgi:hypothetical protein